MRNKQFGIYMKTFVAIALVLCLIFPLIILLNSSLQSYYEIRSWPPVWFKSFNFANYQKVLVGKDSILPAMKNSFMVSSVSMLICILVGSLAAYATSRYRFSGKKVFLLICILTQMFSPTILVTPMFLIFKKIQLLDTLFALNLANTASALPMTIWLLNSYFQAIPLTYEEASWMDGSSRLQGIKNIIFPLAIPGIISAGIFAFIISWGDLVYAQSFITSPENRTISLALMNFQDLYKVEWEAQMAASIITSIPTIVIFIIIQKSLIRGLNAGGLKG